MHGLLHNDVCAANEENKNGNGFPQTSKRKDRQLKRRVEGWFCKRLKIHLCSAFFSVELTEKKEKVEMQKQTNKLTSNITKWECTNKIDYTFFFFYIAVINSFLHLPGNFQKLVVVCCPPITLAKTFLQYQISPNIQQLQRPTS